MNHFLSVLESGSTPADVSDFRRSLQTAVATGAWNERNRARLRRKYLEVSGIEDRREERQVLAQIRLGEMQAVVKPVDWEVLLDVADGFTYAELAAARGISNGSIRTRVSRLRSRLLQ
jgi:DNA-directed RNA polymerase specialized sigma24 family protein